MRIINIIGLFPFLKLFITSMAFVNLFLYDYSHFIHSRFRGTVCVISRFEKISNFITKTIKSWMHSL